MVASVAGVPLAAVMVPAGVGCRFVTVGAGDGVSAGTLVTVAPGDGVYAGT